jgi:CRP/FNR family transcriptional regulator
MRSAIAIRPTSFVPAVARAVPVAKPDNVVRLNNSCTQCGVRSMCLPCRPSAEGESSFEEFAYARRRVRRGQKLFRSGEPFSALYAIRAGSFKTRVAHEVGRDRLAGFHMPGELLGMDGIARDVHAVDAIALEDSDVCVIPYATLLQPGFQRELQRAMSRELIRNQGVLMLLGSMTAEERLAAFLVNFSERLAKRGFSGREFHLRMTRGEIGSYLGLTLETVSRLFSRFQADGLITVDLKHVTILKSDELKALGSGQLA